MAPHSSTLAWKIPWIEEPGGLQSMGSLRVGHNWLTSLSLFTFMHWRKQWQPTPVFLPGESRDGGAWWASVYGVAQSRTWLKWLSSSSSNVSWRSWREGVNHFSLEWSGRFTYDRWDLKSWSLKSGLELGREKASQQGRLSSEAEGWVPGQRGAEFALICSAAWGRRREGHKWWLT